MEDLSAPSCPAGTPHLQGLRDPRSGVVCLDTTAPHRIVLDQNTPGLYGHVQDGVRLSLCSFWLTQRWVIPLEKLSASSALVLPSHRNELRLLYHRF